MENKNERRRERDNSKFERKRDQETISTTKKLNQ